MSPHAKHFAPIFPSNCYGDNSAPRSPGRLSACPKFFHPDLVRNPQNECKLRNNITSPSTYLGSNPTISMSHSPKTVDKDTGSANATPNECQGSPVLTPLDLSKRSQNKKKTVTISNSENESPVRDVTQYDKFVVPSIEKMTPYEFFKADKISISEYPELNTIFKEMDNSKIEEELLKMSEETANWKDISNKNGVKIQRRKDGIVRGQITFPNSTIPPEYVMQFLWEIDPTEYNQMIDGASRIYTKHIHGLSKEVIFYQSFIGSLGFPGRDFILYGTRKKLQDNKYVFACKSTNIAFNSNQSYILQNRIRANCHVGGYVSYTNPQTNELILIALWNLDLKCSLPGFILNQINVQSLNHLSQLRDLLIEKFKNNSTIEVFNTPLRNACSLTPKSILNERSLRSRREVRKGTIFNNKKKVKV